MRFDERFTQYGVISDPSCMLVTFTIPASVNGRAKPFKEAAAGAGVPTGPLQNTYFGVAGDDGTV